MKQTKIKNQLIKSYILILIILLTLALSIFVSFLMYNQSIMDKTAFIYDTFILDYEVGFQHALDQQNLEADDTVTVFDYTYKVLDSTSPLFDKGDQYDYDSVDNIIYGEDLYNYYFFEDMETGNVILLYLAPYNKHIIFLMVAIFIASLLFIIITIILARRSSNQIVSPIQALSKGVHAICQGNYDHIIQYETCNELDSIRDDINKMSLQLKEEIQTRKNLENQKSQLILSLSHDIKTPLTNIIGYSQVLLNQDLDPGLTGSLETIHQYGLNAAALTDELFDYTKLQVNYDRIIMEKVDVVEALRLKLIEYVNEFETLDIRYSLDLPNQAVYCKVNILNFYRLFDNLIQNAIKYNHKAFDLNLMAHVSGDHLIITLEDTGIGIPKAYHKTIFDPMVRVESSRNRSLGGTGLGLSIAKQIMTNHGGNISLDPDYKEGCRFIIDLPILI